MKKDHLPAPEPLEDEFWHNIWLRGHYINLLGEWYQKCREAGAWVEEPPELQAFERVMDHLGIPYRFSFGNVPDIRSRSHVDAGTVEDGNNLTDG